MGLIGETGVVEEGRQAGGRVVSKDLHAVRALNRADPSESGDASCPRFPPGLGRTTFETGEINIFM